MIKTKKIFKKVSVLVGMCLLLGVIGAQAASLTVTTTADGGFGSLRQAIIDATANAEANTVSFNIPTTDPGYNAAENRFTISLSTSLPDVPLAAMTISNDQPQAVTVKGNDTFRIFTLVDSAVVIIDNLTISNGSNVVDFGKNKSFGGGNFGLGGAIFMGASATLTLNKCNVSNNAATDGGGIYITNSGTLNINNSTLSGNTASNNGGAIYNGISGTVNADGNTLNENASTNGGGIYNEVNGTINADSNTIDGNSASNSGGGIYNTATMTLTNNTVSSNTAAVSGGGIYNNFVATLNNNLVALNTAPDGSDLLGRGSLGNAYTGTYNLIGNADGSEGVSGAPNQSGTTAIPILPLLGPLQNNGGSTLTRAVLSGSPAIDKGNSATLIIDQRGQARPYDNMMITNTGNGADIGAYEAQLAPTSADVSVGGRVLVLDGKNEKGISGATVYLSDLSGITRTARTNAFGYYSFADVQVGETYIMDVRHKRYQFDTQVISVFDDMTELNFITFQSLANGSKIGITGFAQK